MKKSTLALSIAAAIGGLGLAGNALAVTDALQGAASNSVMALNTDGIGHQLVFPYFTAQNGNATLLSITNTDTANGKLVKVRFRGAANSDDLYDFTLALSPGDVWTASVTKDAASGQASLDTSDKSCTLPASVKGKFNLDRVDGLAAAQSLEGYVEVINMANIPSVATNANIHTTALFTAIKHVSGVAPCTSAVLSAKLGTDATHAVLTGTQSKTTRGLAVPTTGLTGDWIILNQATSAAWSGSATALEVHASTTSITPVAGNVTFFPQTAGAPLFGAAAVTTTATGTVHNYTADPLLTSGVVAIQNFDLPDMSTPYAATYDGSTSITGVAIANTAGVLTSPAATQADATTAQLAVKSVANQYVTDTAIAAVTDLLFSQPLRRYSAAVNYKSLSSTDAVGTTTTYATNTTSTRSQALYRGANGAGTDSAAVTGKGSAYYGPSSGTATATQGANLSIPSGGRNLCLTTINAPANNTIFDREEITPATTATSTSFVISPAPAAAAAATVRVCGEAAVISINNGGTTGASALGASLARSDFTSTSLTTYANGWVVFATNNGSTTGIPVLGQSFIRAANGAVNYGFSYANKVTR